MRAVTNILYRVERAHWRYQDHLQVVDPALPYLSFQVCVLVLRVCVRAVGLVCVCVLCVCVLWCLSLCVLECVRAVDPLLLFVSVQGRACGNVGMCMCACVGKGEREGWTERESIDAWPCHTHSTHKSACACVPPSFPPFSLSLPHLPPTQTFATELFSQVPALAPLKDDVSILLRHLRRVKAGTRACGAIILNTYLDKCLLVRGSNSSRASFGYCA